MKRKYTTIEAFFIYASGADTDWLDECPQKEVTKFYSIGSLVFLTGFLGFLSSSYAFHSIINPMPIDEKTAWSISKSAILISLCCGLVWGTLVFFLDRAFVSSMSKNSSPINQFFSAIPRFGLAFLISVSISKPFEIYLSKDRISAEIRLNKEAYKRPLLKDLDDQRKQLNSSINNNKDRISVLSAESGSKNYDRLINKAAQEKFEADRVSRDEKEISNGISKAKRARYESLISKDSDSLSDSEQSELNELSRFNGYNYANTSDGGLSKINDLIEKQSTATSKNIHTIQSQKQADSVALKLLDSMYIAESNKIDIQVDKAFSQNLTTQIEALNSLTEGRNIDKKNITEVRVANSLWWYNLIIWLLFLAIEIAPISIKLLMPRGEYDEIAKAHYDSTKSQFERYKIKREKVYSHYYQNAERENMILVDAFFEKIKDKRIAIINSNINSWSRGNASFADLVKNVFSRIIDDVNIIESKWKSVFDFKRKEVLEKAPSKQIDKQHKEETERETDFKKSSLLFRVTKKIKAQFEDEMSKWFFKILSSIGGIYLPIIFLSFFLDETPIEIIKKFIQKL